MCSPRRFLFTQRGSGKPRGSTPMPYGVCLSCSLFSLLEQENHRLSQVGGDPQGSLSPTLGSTEHHPKIRLYVWGHCPDTSWTPSAWCCGHCPGDPVPLTSSFYGVLMLSSIWAASQTKSHGSVQRYRDKLLWKQHWNINYHPAEIWASA